MFEGSSTTRQPIAVIDPPARRKASDLRRRHARAPRGARGLVTMGRRGRVSSAPSARDARRCVSHTRGIALLSGLEGREVVALAEAHEVRQVAAVLHMEQSVALGVFPEILHALDRSCAGVREQRELSALPSARPARSCEQNTASSSAMMPARRWMRSRRSSWGAGGRQVISAPSVRRIEERGGRPRALLSTTFGREPRYARSGTRAALLAARASHQRLPRTRVADSAHGTHQRSTAQLDAGRGPNGVTSAARIS